MSIAVVYDTMLFFQSAARPQRVHTSFAAVQDGRLTLFISHQLIAEIRDVLTRPEHQLKFPDLTPMAVDVFLANAIARSTLIDPIPNLFTWPHHPDDDHLFNLAIHANAKYLVTWETRILKLPNDTSLTSSLLKQLAPNLEIITPKGLAEILRARKT